MYSRGHTEDFVDLYNNAPCGYISLSPDARIAMVNQTLTDWLGYDSEDLIDRPIHDILSFGAKMAYETHLTPLLRLKGWVHEVALDIHDSAGVKLPMLVNAAERRSPSGEMLFTRLTMFRATDRRTFEKSLIEAKVKAEQRSKIGRRAVKLRDQFIAVLGHDLRNPIAAVSAGLGLLHRSKNLNDREHTIVSEMDKSLQRANRLIDDVLDLARGKLGGGLSLGLRADQDLGKVLELIVNEMRAINGEHEIDSRIEIDHLTDCDPDRIAQLASNLLANAVTHGATDQPIVFAARTTADDLTVSVSNGGAPISESARKSLFEPFVRGVTKQAAPGLGLGLFIVDEIAKAHGGKMVVSSTNEETRFTFVMPRKSVQPIAAD